MIVSIMAVGLGEQILHTALSDLEQMFEKLSTEGLTRPGAFRSVLYQRAEGAKALGVVEEVTAGMLDPGAELGSIQARLQLLDYFFHEGSPRNPEHRRSWLERQFRTTIARGAFHHACESYSSRCRELAMPNVILLGRQRFQEVFGREHGMALQASTDNGSTRLGYCLVYPPSYYYQILWHEALHACLGLGECYDEESGEMLPLSSCALASCIMQWDPCKSHPLRERHRWLCEKQRTAAQDFANILGVASRSTDPTEEPA